MLIKKQDAIDAVCTHGTELERRGITVLSVVNHKQATVDLLEQLPSAQQWIPCSERLPEENGRYLVTNSAWGAMEVDWNAWVNGEWLYPNTKPIAWMPLPEPWKGKEDG